MPSKDQKTAEYWISREMAELRRDKARVDILEQVVSHGDVSITGNPGHDPFFICLDQVCGDGDTLREALDSCGRYLKATFRTGDDPVPEQTP